MYRLEKWLKWILIYYSTATKQTLFDFSDNAIQHDYLQFFSRFQSEVVACEIILILVENKHKKAFKFGM